LWCMFAHSQPVLPITSLESRNLSLMEGQELVGALSSATSYNAAEREAATTYLEQCQPLPGFLTALIETVAQKGALPVEIRTQAVLFFKNSLERCWRKLGGPRSAFRAIVPFSQAHNATTVLWMVLTKLSYAQNSSSLSTSPIERSVNNANTQKRLLDRTKQC
jgi:hypothetical protein